MHLRHARVFAPPHCQQMFYLYGLRPPPPLPSGEATSPLQGTKVAAPPPRFLLNHSCPAFRLAPSCSPSPALPRSFPAASIRSLPSRPCLCAPHCCLCWQR
jgi:hypothetical protein